VNDLSSEYAQMASAATSLSHADLLVEYRVLLVHTQQLEELTERLERIAERGMVQTGLLMDQLKEYNQLVRKALEILERDRS
jgi:hypothetical protein